MSVYTRSAVPAGVEACVFYAHGDNVFFSFGVEVGGEVVGEWSVSIGVISQVVSIEPYVAVHVNAVEVEEDNFFF